MFSFERKKVELSVVISNLSNSLKDIQGNIFLNLSKNIILLAKIGHQIIGKHEELNFGFCEKSDNIRLFNCLL